MKGPKNDIKEDEDSAEIANNVRPIDTKELQPGQAIDTLIKQNQEQKDKKKRY